MGPRGMFLRLSLHSSWGDPYYLGLDALALFGADGQSIPLRPSQISAAPHSLKTIGFQDSRLPANLAVPPPGDRLPVEHSASWLSPLAASLGLNAGPGGKGRGALAESGENEIYVSLDRPTTLAAIRVWNYSKTPERGVREMSVWFDDLLIHRCALARAEDGAGSAGGRNEDLQEEGNSAGGMGAFCQSLIFTNDPKIVRRERPFVHYCGSEEQDVLCINERQVCVRSRSMYDGPDPSAVGVWDTQRENLNANRPATSGRP